MLELNDIADVVADAVREATAPLIERIDALERRELDFGPLESRLDAAEERLRVVGDRGPDIAALEERLAEVEAREIPEAIKGDPGEVDMEALAELIDKAVASLPVPKDGEPCDMAEVERMVAERVAAAVEALPPPKDGIGLANALKDQDGCLVLVMTDGTTKNLGRIDGENGKTFTLDDFDIVPVDERTIKMGFVVGDTMHSFELAFPFPIYRGVFREAETYERGDLVTWAGSTWHCDEPKGLKPGVADSGWTLAVKAGRPGKDAAK